MVDIGILKNSKRLKSNTSNNLYHEVSILLKSFIVPFYLTNLKIFSQYNKKK